MPSSFLAGRAFETAAGSLAALADAFPLGVISLAPDGTLTGWNPGAERMFGWKADEVIGRKPPHVPEGRSEEFDALLKRVLDGHSFMGLELVRRRKDGAEVAVSLSASPLHEDTGGVTGIVAVFADVTPQTHIQEELARAAAIVEGSEDAIVSYDLDGTVMSWNPGAERMYGYAAAEVVGRPCTATFLTQAQWEEVRSVFARIGRGEPVPIKETLRSRKDRTTLPVSLTVFAVRCATGRITGLATICRDIRDRKKAENEIRVMNRFLHRLSSELLRSQDEERRRIARELHDSTAQTLAAATMNLSLVQTFPGVASDPAVRQLISETITLAEQCSQEVRSLSYLLHPPLLDELGLASALRFYAEGFSRRTGIRVDLDLPEEMERLAADVETTLFRIVQEGLSNVHRHSGSGEAAISISFGQGSILLELRDAGRGVPPTLFEDQAMGKGSLGVGILGMRERAIQLGGRLDIESDGGGTTVRVVLPVGTRP